MAAINRLNGDSNSPPYVSATFFVSSNKKLTENQKFDQELFMCQGTAKFDWLESSVTKACRALC
jgi:hypothetical protein